MKFPLFLPLLKVIGNPCTQGALWPPLDRKEFLGQSQPITRTFVFQLQDPCMEQSLNSDRCLPRMLCGIPFGMRETVCYYPSEKFRVPPGHEIVGSNLLFSSVSHDLRLFISTLQDHIQIYYWLLTVSPQAVKARHAAGFVGGPSHSKEPAESFLEK